MNQSIASELRKLFIETSKGVVLEVVVYPNSDREALVYRDGELLFYTNEPPLQGRANAALIRFLSKRTRIPSSRIEIVYGARSRVKRVLFRDTSIDELVEAIASTVET